MPDYGKKITKADYSKIYNRVIFPNNKTKSIFIILIVFFLLLGCFIVKYTGGTQFAYLHLLYIPIILSGCIFSIRGGILAGLCAGILLSPLFHFNNIYDMEQPFFSWTMRMFFFTFVGAFSGISSSLFRAYLQELEIKQITEPWTGLPNIDGLVQKFSEITAGNPKSVMIIVVEIFQMRDLEHALGMEGLRFFLAKLSANFQEAIGTMGTLGILQGRHFTILIPEEKNLETILENCKNFAQKPYRIDGVPFFIEIRFGISRYPYDGENLNTLTRKALIAINLPKNQSAQVSRFDNHADDTSNHNLLILHQLKNAIDNNLLTLEYQPKIWLKTNKVLGFEALVRWNDPLLGIVSPDKFIPLAEETLLIQPFTQWLLETSLQQMHRWHNEGLLVKTSVNFAMKNFHHPAIFATLLKLLETYQIPPHFLEIEVTETSVAANLSIIAQALEKFREIGLSVAIDDFGTGQASQQYLLELPIDVIKIDKIFVHSIVHNPAAAAIVKNAILLAHDLNLQVIAEGIETQKQLSLLKQWGCDGAQGYFIGQSMTESDATQWLKKMLKA